MVRFLKNCFLKNRFIEDRFVDKRFFGKSFVKSLWCALVLILGLDLLSVGAKASEQLVISRTAATINVGDTLDLTVTGQQVTWNLMAVEIAG